MQSRFRRLQRAARRLIAGSVAASFAVFTPAGCQSAHVHGGETAALASAYHDHDLPAGHHRDHALLHPASDPAADCTCAAATQHNGWCRHCNAGYVAGLRVESARLFETLDPHGHEFLLESLACPTCRQAVGTNGYCDTCHVGFVNDQAYFTKLTYGLALGRPVTPADVRCRTCAGHAAAPGWCDKCGRGIVGPVAYGDRKTFDTVAHEYRILSVAIRTVPTCEVCACAMVAHRSCAQCGLSFE